MNPTMNRYLLAIVAAVLVAAPLFLMNLSPVVRVELVRPPVDELVRQIERVGAIENQRFDALVKSIAGEPLTEQEKQLISR